MARIADLDDGCPGGVGSEEHTKTTVEHVKLRKSGLVVEEGE